MNTNSVISNPVPRVSVEKQQQGHYILMLGDGPTPSYTIEFVSADVCRETLVAALNALADVACELGD